MVTNQQKWNFVARLLWWALSSLYNHFNSKHYGKD